MYSKGTVVQNFNGRKLEFVMTIDGAFILRVKDISAKGYEMDAQFGKLAMSMEVIQVTMEFSAENANVRNIESLMHTKY